MRGLLRRLHNVIPLALLLLISFFHQHVLGIAFFSVSTAVFVHLDTLLREQVALKEQARRLVLARVITLSAAQAVVTFVMFRSLTPRALEVEQEQQQAQLAHAGGHDGQNLIMFGPQGPAASAAWCRLRSQIFAPYCCGANALHGACDDPHGPGLFDVLWLVMANDFMARFGTVCAKGLVALAPMHRVLLMLPGAPAPGDRRDPEHDMRRVATFCYRKKRQLYACIELCSIVLRQLLATPPWVQYYGAQGNASLISLMFAFSYVSFKITIMKQSLSRVGGAITTLISNEHGVGRRVTPAELIEQGNPDCPICYETMQAPIILACGHTFCEDCAQEWCDRERTCPLCRAPIEQPAANSTGHGRGGAGVGAPYTRQPDANVPVPVRPELLDGATGLAPQLF